MEVKIMPKQEHYEVHIGGQFFCSADTLSEAQQEINQYTQAQGKLPREINIP